MKPNEKYRDAAAFRAAVESRLRQSAVTRGEAWLVRQRKFMVFDRLLARLLRIAPDRWILKGAVALDFRFGNRARATIDLDLARQDGETAAMEDLQDAGLVDLGDYFILRVERTNKLDNPVDGVAVRYKVQANLDGRRFEQAILDVGFDQELGSAPDLLVGPDFFAFAGIPPIEVPALPLEQHVAEKLHAYARIYGDGRQSTRVKDLIDLVLIAQNSTFDAGRLRSAIEMTFATRATQTVPSAFHEPPRGWSTPYRALAMDTGLDPDIASGHALVARFLDPMLSQIIQTDASWHPAAGVWRHLSGSL